MTIIYHQFDVVVVPFSFTDREATKRRPALVLSDSANFREPRKKDFVKKKLVKANYLTYSNNRK